MGKDNTILTDFILYSHLGNNPKNEDVESLLRKYNDFKEQFELIIDRLHGVHQWKPLYSEWFEEYLKRTEEIERSLDWRAALLVFFSKNC